jgi:hypothetical protein
MRHVLAEWPPLTNEERSQIAALLAAPANRHDTEAATTA